MATAQHTMRIDGPLMEAAAKRGATEGLRGKSEIVRAALGEYAGNGDGCQSCRERAIRVTRLEVELAQAQAKLARYEADGADGPSAAERDRAIADLIRGATPEDPATPARLAAVSGLMYRQVLRILAALVAAGYVTRIEKGCYLPAPGMDPLEGMGAIRGRVAALNGASGGSGEADGGSPVPVPRVTPAAASRARNGKLAGAVERASAAGAPLVAAKDLPRPGAAVFQEPGAQAVAVDVPEVPDHSGKRSRARAKCTHYVPAGTKCKICE